MPNTMDLLMQKEARASVSLDGDTQSCDACTLERTAGPHRCGRRDITPEELEMCDAVLAFAGRHGGVRYAKAVRALRKARGGA